MTTMVPPAEPRSYYGRPVIKEPIWKPEIPIYFFTGGLAGASAGLAFAARVSGNDKLARAATGNALAGIVTSPTTLIPNPKPTPTTAQSQNAGSPSLLIRSRTVMHPA